jgi:predicted ATPase/class 3 adenylate cyclase
MRTELPSGTVTFLFTDIEGSTRLLHALGPDGYAEALAEHRRALRAVFAAHDGVEVDTQGDAFFVAFPTAPGAVAAAQAGQQALEPGPIRVRMGLHTGAPTVTAEGYVGVDVHRGARVAALASGRQVLLTEATAALLGTDEATLGDLGRHRLKDFDGPTRVLQLGTETFPPLRTPGAVDLPTPATRFLGREQELFAAISAWFEHDPRIFSVVGPGGTGKTRFSLELARLLAEDADGGTVFVPLAPLRDTDLVFPAIAERLGAAGDGSDAIAARIGERRTHVVLDNLEQLLPDLARPLAELAAAAPTLRLLVTSREPLRIAGELEHDLPPMAEDDAVTLFLARAHAVRPDLEDSTAVRELARRLDGLPLALELAAARTKALAPEQLLERIAQRLDMLKGGRDVDERHSTLRATIAWSHELLEPGEQELFARLAVFRGGCSLDAAEQVCDADIDSLASLLDKSLLRRRAGPDGADRYWMLETIGEFAAERLKETGDESRLRRRQIGLLVDVAHRAGLGGVTSSGATRWELDVIAPELDNVRAALTWAVEHDAVLGLELATALEEFWVVRDPTEGTSWLERLLPAASEAPPRLRARAARAIGGTLDIFGAHDKATPYYAESLGLFEELPDQLEAANVRFRVAANLVNRGERTEATRRLEEALVEFRRLDHSVGEAQAVGYLGYMASIDGDLEIAAERFEESLAIVREHDWAWWEISMLSNLADVCRRLGRLDSADRYARASFQMAGSLGDRMSSVFAAAEVACVASLCGDVAAAGRIWGAIEAEVDASPLGQWAAHREEYEAVVLRASAEFEEWRERGSLLSLTEAVGGEVQTEP